LSKFFAFKTGGHLLMEVKVLLPIVYCSAEIEGVSYTQENTVDTSAETLYFSMFNDPF